MSTKGQEIRRKTARQTPRVFQLGLTDRLLRQVGYHNAEEARRDARFFAAQRELAEQLGVSEEKAHELLESDDSIAALYEPIAKRYGLIE